MKKFRNFLEFLPIETFSSIQDFKSLLLEEKKTKRKTLKIAQNKKRKILKLAATQNSSNSLNNLSQSTDPIMTMIEKIERNKEEIIKIFNAQIDSLCEATSNLEIVCVPYQGNKKRSILNAIDDEENSSVVERILKKPKLNSLLEYNFPIKKNIYLENMLKLNVENSILNEVSLCEETTTISEKENTSMMRNEKNSLYVYKSNIPNEKQVCIEITKSDWDRVADNLLNDTIILFYLKFIQNELIDEGRRNKTYIFNTYFYQRFFMSLNNMIVNQLSDKDYEKGYSAIKNVIFPLIKFSRIFLVD